MVNFTDLTDDEKTELARQDDCLKYLVPSDIRVMLGDISRLRDALQGVRGDLVLLQMAIEHQANDTELLRRIALMEADMKRLLDVRLKGGE